MAGVDMIQQGVEVLSVQDRKPVDADLIDNIAKSLLEDWTKLGRQFGLEEYVLEQIDIDCSSVRDKAFAILKKWKQKSPFEVTRGILKRHLQRIERNDIVLDFLAEGAKTTRLKHIAKEKGLTSPTDNEFTICALSTRHITFLKSMLDQDHGAGIKNWRHLGAEIFKDNQEVFSRVNNLDLHYSGGGNPSLAFFKSLSMRKPEVTLQEFIDVAKDFERNDVVFYVEEINGIDNGMQFRHLPDKHKDAIASMLNKRVAGVYDWRMFAEEFEFSQMQIQNIESSIKELNSYSPTMKLFTLLKQTKPLMPLQELVEICEKLQRNDVALYLKGVIKEQETK